ncbi:MAG: phospholipid carrier-dependent glycosyltransferase [Anaerolineaceae bacterium]|nr:phospholipid carrier-dependent glycosyltransferase [Anaerolineaceae bacterium]
MKQEINSHRSFSFGIVILALLGFLLVILAPHPLGAGADSLTYVSAAQSYAAGEGLRNLMGDGRTEVLTHFPPMYSLLLSGLGWVDNPVAVAKWLHASLFFGNVLLLGLILRQLTRHNWLSLAGAAMLLTSELLVRVHIYIWTEALFIFWLLVAVYSLGYYEAAETQTKKFAFLSVTAVFIGLSTLTRYVGVTLIGTTIVLLLLAPSRGIRQKWYEVALFTFVSSMPLALWFIRNAILGDSIANRVIAYHAVPWKFVLAVLQLWGLWVLPGIRVSFGAGLAYLLLMTAAIGMKYRFGHPVSKVFLWCCFFVFLYFGFLLFSTSFIDASTPLNYRILLPMFVVSLIVILAGVADLVPKIQTIPFVRLMPLAAFLVYLVLNLIASWRIVYPFYQYGLGYTAVYWQESKLAAQAALLGENTLIYSNAPDALYFTSDLICRRLPITTDPTTLQTDIYYAERLESMFNQVEAGDAIIVYFDAIDRWYLPAKAELSQLAPLTAAFENEEGTIYVWKDGGN